MDILLLGKLALFSLLFSTDIPRNILLLASTLKLKKFILKITETTAIKEVRSVPHVSQGQGPDDIDHIGMATSKSLGEWNTKSTTGRPEAEVPILSVCINDIQNRKYNIVTVGESAGHLINNKQQLKPKNKNLL